jgi:predicted methyltransferase MtxX (methanogen marker protein 4)
VRNIKPAEFCYSLHMDENIAFNTSVDTSVGIGLVEGDPREAPLLSSVAFCPVYIFRDPGAMFDAMEDHMIDAAVRGSLPSDEFLRELESRRHGVRRRRIAVMVLEGGKPFLLGPVGIDEGGTMREMGRLVGDMRDFCDLLGWEPRIAVLSAGRPGDAARSGSIASSIRRGEVTAERYGVRHYNIMIEEAMEWANCVIAPDGVSGNLVYRTLSHLGGAVSLGALYFPLQLKLADTSRNGAIDEYVGAIALANLAASGRYG